MNKTTDPVTAVLAKMGCNVLRVESHTRPVITVSQTDAVKQLDGIPVRYGLNGVLYSAPFHGCDVEWIAPRG